MTELYIDRQRVVLPKSLNIPIIEENPFFTKDGKYTLDITLSLAETENAIVYGHLYRLNKKDYIAKDRTAYMVVNNEVILNGTEIIVDWSDKSVKLQLVSGNSELNFLVGGNDMIRNLDLGKAEPLTNNDQYLDAINKTYPQINYQFLPFYTNERDIIFDGEQYGHHLSVGNEPVLEALPRTGDIRTSIRPSFRTNFSLQTAQPYFCFIIDQVIKAVGYNLIYNCLAEHPVFKNAYMVHGIQTYDFAKMLPEWTVNEFLTEIEQLFDCCFIVEEESRDIRLLFNYQSREFINGGNKIDIEVLDEFEVENDDDNRLTVRNGNIGYSLDSDKYYQYMRLAPRILDIRDYGSSGLPLDIFIEFMNANPEGLKPSRTIYSFDDSADKFIIFKTDHDLTLKKVNSFANLINNEDKAELDIEFNIIPAAMAYARLRIFDAVNGVIQNSFTWVQVPIAGDYDSLIFDRFGQSTGGIEHAPDYDIQELIEGTQTFTETVPSKIRLAIYSGVQKLDYPEDSVLQLDDAYFPTAYVESLCEFFQDYRVERHFGTKGLNPFRFDYLNETIYSQSTNVDTTKTHKLIFKDPGKFNIRAEFVGNNRAFVCTKIERTIIIDGFAENVKGDFYPYNY